MSKTKKPFIAGAAAVISFGSILFCSIVILEASVHVGMLLGCGVAAAISYMSGSGWKDIESGIVGGIAQSLPSLVILLLIGVLIGIWIDTRTVQALIYYGLLVLKPGYFLASAMIICSILSMTLGSWGTAGTVGLALMGIAKVMDIPATIAAGAIISGAYFGDQASPLSDTANLAATAAGSDVFDNARHMLPVAGTAYIISLALYLFIGAKVTTTGLNQENLQKLIEQLNTFFNISPLHMLPLLVLGACVVLRVPSIPCIASGILSAAILGILLNENSVTGLFESAYSGYVSRSGEKVIDQLFSAGGIESMMYSISMIMCAMMFGGIMEHTGLMEAFMEPVRKFINSAGRLIAATVLSCAAIDMTIPEQYIAISLPGHMFGKEYERLGVNRRELARGLSAGGAGLSPLIPWNTCGIFMSGILGVSAFEYGRYAFLNLTIPILTIFLGYFPLKRLTALIKKS